jgi:hypothetical protein
MAGAVAGSRHHRRSGIRRQAGEPRYRHVLVDEAQDLHPAQWRLRGERCVLFAACTLARDHLFVSGTGTPSPFLPPGSGLPDTTALRAGPAGHEADAPPASCVPLGPDAAAVGRPGTT